ncbi:TPA: DsbC family protein [Vibrio parahaemolyticus]
MKKIAILLSLAFASSAIANTNTIKEQLPKETYDAIAQYYPVEELASQDGIHLESKFSLNSDFYVLSLNDSVLAISEDGKYILGGDVVNMQDMVNHLEQAKDQSRKRIVSSLTDEQFIEYPSKLAESKGVLYIYSDVTCGYCQRLHEEYAEINEAGYDIKVVPFVRNVGAPNFEQSRVYKNTVAMMSVQDQAKKREIHDQLMLGDSVDHSDNNTVGVNAVKSGIETGVRVGLQGTPHLVFDDGRAVSGYVPASSLLQLLSEK